MRPRFARVLLILLFLSHHAHAADPPKPPAPAETVPSLALAQPPVLCVACDAPFDTGTHERLLEGLANNPFQKELRRALYLQDSANQFESRVHFDNCDFGDAMAYITDLLGEVDAQVKLANAATKSGDKQAESFAGRKAFFALGQALHGVQDFYAHSNYVELNVLKVARIELIPIVPVWRQEGRDMVTALVKQGLISGYVFWGFPQKCPSGSLSHANLAKDSQATRSGSVRVKSLQNHSQYDIAFFLAREGSLRLLTDAFVKWPTLKRLNGEALAVDVLVDRRGL